MFSFISFVVPLNPACPILYLNSPNKHTINNESILRTVFVGWLPLDWICQRY